MFGRKKMYKRGMEDAMRAYEAFGKKQEEALEKIREEIRCGNKQLEDMISALGEDLVGIYDFLSSKEKAALYQLCTPKDIKDLGEEEKRVLVAVLYQLAAEEGILAVTENQKKYIRSVQKYLEITNPQTSIDLNVVGDIDSVDDQKAILQTVLEFYYLQDATEISDSQEEFLDNFCLNKKQAQQIEMYVAKLYNTVGPEGLCEKYGFVENIEDLTVIDSNNETHSGIDFYYDCRINAAKFWSDDTIIFEPREQCSLAQIEWVDNVLIWSGKSTGEWIKHVIDLRTLEEIGTIPDGTTGLWQAKSTKYFCYIDNKKDDCFVIKDYCNSLHKEINGKQKWNSDYINIYGIIDDNLILKRNVELDSYQNYYQILRYNFIEDKTEIIDTFYMPTFLMDAFTIDGRVYMVVNPSFDKYDAHMFDLWCYDLKQNKYVWKQYKSLKCEFMHAGKVGEQCTISYDNKVEFCMESGVSRYRRVIVDKNSGKILSQQELEPGDSSPYKYVQKIDHTVIYMFFGYNNGRDFFIYTFTFDISEDATGSVAKDEMYDHTFGQDTEQSREILRRMGLQ